MLGQKWIRIGGHYINLAQVIEIITEKQRYNHSSKAMEPCVVFVRALPVVVEVYPHFGTIEEWQQLMADVVDYSPEPPFADTYGVLYADDNDAIENDYAWIQQGC